MSIPNWMHKRGWDYKRGCSIGIITFTFLSSAIISNPILDRKFFAIFLAFLWSCFIVFVMGFPIP